MRTCVFDLPGLSARLLDSLPTGAAPAWLNALRESNQAVIRPVLPAVTMTVQATYTTGVDAAGHGMIANGLPAYRLPELRDNLDLSNYEDYRANVSFWEQSDKLLTADRAWRANERKTAMLFVQSSMGGACDVVVTPKPEHTPDGKTISTCWASPEGLNERLVEELGMFPLHHYWGPMAGLPSTQWIAQCAERVWDWHPVDLQWVYVPQLDYDLQKLGPGAPECVESLAKVFEVLTPLVEKVQADGGRVVVLSEYGMTAVNRAAAPNALFAKAGLLQTNEKGEVDYEASDVFALCDHQVAHIYCKDEAATDRAAEILEGVEEVAGVYRGAGRAEVGLDCDRAGDLVIFSHEDAWFEYRWWEDFAAAPDFIWTVDIHRKPGYDPLEMFANRETRKILADQPQMIKGSHGARPADPKDWPILLGIADASAVVEATDIASLV